MRRQENAETREAGRRERRQHHGAVAAEDARDGDGQDEQPEGRNGAQIELSSEDAVGEQDHDDDARHASEQRQRGHVHPALLQRPDAESEREETSASLECALHAGQSPVRLNGEWKRERGQDEQGKEDEPQQVQAPLDIELGEHSPLTRQ